MNYYIQQRFFIYYMAEEKIFTSYIGDSRCTCRNKKPTDAALGKTVFLR